MPVDSYGVGSSLIRGANDFTADVVLTDGLPSGKVGRRLPPERPPRARRASGRFRAARGRWDLLVDLLWDSAPSSLPTCIFTWLPLDLPRAARVPHVEGGRLMPRVKPTEVEPASKSSVTGRTSPAWTRRPPSSRRSSTSCRPAPLRAARRARPQGHPALRAARDRQDPAREGGRPRLRAPPSTPRAPRPSSRCSPASAPPASASSSTRRARTLPPSSSSTSSTPSA